MSRWSLLKLRDFATASDSGRPEFTSLSSRVSRAQDRWEHQVAEQETLDGLNSELAFQGYPDTFQKARHL